MAYEQNGVSVEKMLQVPCRSLITMDGLWFLAVEEAYGLEKAIELDIKVWDRFMPIHSRRVARTCGLSQKGILALLQVIEVDPLWVQFKPEFVVADETRGVLRFTDCPPQRARVRDGKGEFPCKPVGIACFESMLRTFAPEAELNCVVCPPDPHPRHIWCEWEFKL